MENPKRYRLTKDTIFGHPYSDSTTVVRKDQIVSYHGYEHGNLVLVRYASILSNRDYTALISKQYIEEIGTRQPVDRSAWREGIDQVQGYLPAMNDATWAYLRIYSQPLYDGLRKMHENGPDND